MCRRNYVAASVLGPEYYLREAEEPNNYSVSALAVIPQK